MVKDKAIQLAREKAVQSVKAALVSEIDQLINPLKRLNPDLLGNETQLLAYTQIEVLNLVKEIVKSIKVK